MGDDFLNWHVRQFIRDVSERCLYLDPGGSVELFGGPSVLDGLEDFVAEFGPLVSIEEEEESDDAGSFFSVFAGKMVPSIETM